MTKTFVPSSTKLAVKSVKSGKTITTTTSQISGQPKDTSISCATKPWSQSRYALNGSERQLSKRLRHYIVKSRRSRQRYKGFSRVNKHLRKLQAKSINPSISCKMKLEICATFPPSSHPHPNTINANAGHT